MSKIKIIAAVCSMTSATLYDDKGKAHNYSTFEAFDYITKNVIPELGKNGFAEVDTNALDGLPTWDTEEIAKYFGIQITETTNHFNNLIISKGKKSERKVTVKVQDQEIKNAESLLPFMEMAMNFGSKAGVKKFLERLAKINESRGHTVQDILRFLEKADLPIAEDGTIVAYKLLNYYRQGAVTHKTTYVDCHTGNIKQKVGSHVFMDEKLVNPDRSVECSCGLHIARRDYLKSFGGQVCVLVKVNPEDIIAIPHNDASKIRTKAYHIVAVLPGPLKELVMKNKPIDSDPKGKVLLSRVIDGNHVPILEEVEITKNLGKGIINEKPSTKADIKEATAKVKEKKVKKLHSTREPEKQVSKTAISKEQVNKMAKIVSPAVQIRNLLTKPITKETAKKLFEYKKLAKKSWSYFGATEDQIKKLDSFK